MFKTTLAALLLASALAVPALSHDAKLPPTAVSEELQFQRKTVAVLDSTMTFIETGNGSTVLFLHGNPTSAYLWRNILPYAGKTHRAVAVDLIGMGGSGKPDIDYTFADHVRYLDAFIETLGPDPITLVGHDWGAALAWYFARRYPDRVTKIAFMEGVLPPAFPKPSFESMGELGNMFRAFKDETEGHKLVIEQNMFVEQILPNMVNRPLGETAKTEYGAPFRTEKDRRPTLAWPREVPIAGRPGETVAALTEIETFMQITEMPVLLLYADPGILVPPVAVDWYTARISGLETVYIGQGFHFFQEDQPDAVGRAIADWIRRH